MSPEVARNRHGGAVAACPLSRDERTWPGRGSTSENDPGLRENVRARKARRIVFSIVLSRQPSPALLFFKLIEVETKFPFANSISSFSRSQDPQQTFTKGDRPSATSPIEISGRCRAQEDRRRNRGGASRTDPSNKGDRAYRASAIYARFRTFCATYCPTLRPISSPVRIENL
jgi:hypothetical protein